MIFQVFIGWMMYFFSLFCMIIACIIVFFTMFCSIAKYSIIFIWVCSSLIISISYFSLNLRAFLNLLGLNYGLFLHFHHFHGKILIHLWILMIHLWILMILLTIF